MSNLHDMEHLDTAHQFRVVALALIRASWLFIVCFVALFLGDWVFILGDEVRFGLDILLLLMLFLGLVYTYYGLRHTLARRHMLARMIEAKDPEMKNILVNALDFQATLSEGPPQGISQPMMEEEIRLANEQLAQQSDFTALTPPSLTKERRILVGLIFVCLVALVPCWSAISAIVPRLLLPFGDFPPYSQTQFTVDPGNAVVDYGENFVVTVITAGRIPKSMTLVILDTNGNEAAEYPMFDAGDGLFFQTLENVEDDRIYFARIARGRSKRYALSVTKLPRIEDAVVTYTYPAYTRLKPKTRVLLDEPMRGYPGTSVTLRIASNRPLQAGHLVIAGKSVDLAPKDSKSVEGTFSIVAEGTYEAVVEDIDGLVSQETIQGKVEFIEDKKPEIVLASPGMDSFAVVGSEVPIEIEAADDLGLTKISLVRNHNGSRDARKVLYTGDGSEDAMLVTETLDLKDLGVRPGDIIEYYAIATDSRPDAPQTASTTAFTLRIISFEEYREYIQSQMTATDLREKYEALLEEMQALADAQRALQEEVQALQEKLATKGSLSESEEERLAELTAAQEALAEATAAFAEKLAEQSEQPAIFDIEEEYKRALAEFAEQALEANAHMKNAQESLAKAGEGRQPGEPGEAGQAGQPAALSDAEKAQNEALKALGESLGAFREGILAASENLEHVMGVVTDTETFKYLYTLQKGLERQARFYKEMADPSLEDQVRMKELAEHQEEIRKALKELSANLRLHADELEALGKEQTAQEDLP